MLIEISISANLKKIIDGLSPENIKAAMKAGMQNLVSHVEARAVQFTPVKTSNLVNSILSYVADGGATGILKATATYAKFVHDGTGLYGPLKKEITIVAKDKKALYWPGAKHPVKKVTQKGIHPNPFFTKALKQVNPQKLFEEGASNFILRRLR